MEYVYIIEENGKLEPWSKLSLLANSRNLNAGSVRNKAAKQGGYPIHIGSMIIHKLKINR